MGSPRLLYVQDQHLQSDMQLVGWPRVLGFEMHREIGLEHETSPKKRQSAKFVDEKTEK